MGQKKMKVAYWDYLGIQQYGYIELVQPCPTATEEGEAYLYISDENPKLNDKTYTDPNGNVIRYADIRRSTECVKVGAVI